MSGVRGLVLLAVLGATGCAWRVDATRATGLCLGKAVVIHEVRDQGRSSSWMAACRNSIARYRCAYVHALSRVTCEYRPICGNDRFQDTRGARFRR